MFTMIAILVYGIGVQCSLLAKHDGEADGKVIFNILSWKN